MQIEKINENQLEVTLNLEDLRKNNISLHSFMCNSVESQHLFFDILSFADEEIGFSLKNYEIVIEAFSVPVKSSFVLLITRVPKATYLHPSKLKYNTFKAIESIWIKFDSLDDFCMFCGSIKANTIFNPSLYLLDEHYFLHIRTNKVKKYFEILTKSREFSNYIYGNDFVLDENAKLIIESSAIETCTKYFL